MRKILMLMALTAVLLPASMNADAGGRGYGHRGGYGHSHARVGVGFYFGAPLLYAPLWAPRPYYYPSYYYDAPPVVVRERVIVQEPLVFYDENGNPVSSTAPAQVQAQAQTAPSTQPQAGAPAPTWYFCADSQKYYPYVQTCASPWQRVVPQSPPQ